MYEIVLSPFTLQNIKFFFTQIFISEQYDERNRNKECRPPCSLMWFSVGIPNKVENIGNNGTAQFFFKSVTTVQETIFGNRQYIFSFYLLLLKQSLSNCFKYVDFFICIGSHFSAESNNIRIETIVFKF
jgi:hypothetical protein